MNFQPNPGAPSEALAALSGDTRRLLPPEYVEFMTRCDGGEGFLDDEYAALWRIEELEPFNADYESKSCLQNTILIGSDGGGEAYAFRTIEGGIQFVRVPFIGMSDDACEAMDVSFAEFVRAVGMPPPISSPTALTGYDTYMITVEELIEEFAEFEDWQDRYRYLLEMGDELPEFPEAEKTDANLVQGCQSRVWMIADVDDTPDRKLHLQADSDSAIVRGLIAILVALYDDRPASEAKDVPIETAFQQIGLGQRLSPQRSNGFYSMVNRIRELAANGR